MTDVPVSRGEFELVKTMLSETNGRLNTIDTNGTRGVIGVQAQVADLVKDLTEMKLDMHSLKQDMKEGFKSYAKDISDKFESHTLQHKQEVQARRSNRKWVIATVIAALAAMAGIGSMLAIIFINLPGAH